ncbi:DNA-directed RNA polymerase subunit alpha [Estrella lausannensis]|uniref:DNA-directed RNA polymerase subunit alpha n=1 Tax=Estrella lausannensis TaxID=483423 RepID=G1FGU0_9BACT|nr:DNA-directed RNA polymerase subunit alpha [Estrella lausannensis]AEM01131.1 DNA-directed RNA polymerase subunit alpha [Estrella lausannensis]CRX37868.1 DNA-directed RNA polymerase, alpha subunit [Estrella lausannensis]
MSLKYGKFELPTNIILEEENSSRTFGRFIAEPFERGFGHTIGNAMRRMMLSSIEAPAIIAVRIQGVPHEYMAIEGVIEDMTNIVLNLKSALLRKLPSTEEANSKEQRIITSTIEVTQEMLDAHKGQVSIKLGDIIKAGNFEVVNPQLHLFYVTKPMKKQIDVRVAFGRGYVPSERHNILDKASDDILIDACYSPVRLVSYYVENTRVGQDTDFDKLIMDVTTDGRITPREAVSFAAQIATHHFEVFNKMKTIEVSFEDGEDMADTDDEEILEKLSYNIDEIELSVRSTNCLQGANIETIAELVIIPERKMLEFRNFGKKSLNEIKAKLQEMGLSLGMDLKRFDITLENVKDKVKALREEVKRKKNGAREKENANA